MVYLEGLTQISSIFSSAIEVDVDTDEISPSPVIVIVLPSGFTTPAVDFVAISFLESCKS